MTTIQSEEVKKYINLGYAVEEQVIQIMQKGSGLVYETTIKYMDEVLYKGRAKEVRDGYDFALDIWKQHHRDRQLNKLI